MEIKFDFDDILIKPAVVTSIKSRKEVYPYIDGHLPIITAPMDTVINDASNEQLYPFLDNKINICLARGINGFYKRDKHSNCLIFSSFSLYDFVSSIDDIMKKNKKAFICIDMANGHMEELYDVTKEYKEKYGKSLVLMIGNIANPETYKHLSKTNADFIRCSVGSGNACLTSQNVSIGYPMASLIKEIYEIKKDMGSETKIVADGGMKNYSDIIKALALGADYVILGSTMNKALESCSVPYLFNKIPLKNKLLARKAFNLGFPLYKKFRGMSTKEVQKDWGRDRLTTAEGVVKYNRVEYTMGGWKDNFVDYLRSAMSYSNSKNLSEFKESEFVLITEKSYKRFNK